MLHGSEVPFSRMAPVKGFQSVRSVPFVRRFGSGEEQMDLCSTATSVLVGLWEATGVFEVNTML